MISDNLYSQIQEDLAFCDRMQMLTLATFGLERLWRMFEDWTKTEGDPLLYQKPNSFRQRMRNILDHIWEQIESGQEINPYEKEFVVLSKNASKAVSTPGSRWKFFQSK